MMKKFLSTTLGGALLLLGAGAANAFPLIVQVPSSGNFDGYVTVSDFAHRNGAGNWVTDVGGSFNVSLTNLAGTVNFFDTSITGGHVKADGTVWFDPSGTSIDTPSGDLLTFDFSGTTIFTGNLNATFNVPSLTFGSGVTQTVTPGLLGTFDWDGESSLFNDLLAGLGLPSSYHVAGSSTVTITSIDPQTMDLTVGDNCIPNVPPGNVCLQQLLTGLDSLGSNPGTIDGAFRIVAGSNLVVPEPASLALMGIGIAGLGFIRRKKAA